jgi:hypothetical protein
MLQMADFQFKTPVALFIYNRPETARLVFAEIAKARPPKLLIVGDGPRTDRSGEAEKVASVRAIVGHVNWDCEVVTNFSDVNLGAKLRIAGGLDWVFTQVPEVIILEDDCLPDPTFFRFCEELLSMYRSDQRVSMISGDNFQFGHRRTKDSYYFSRYGHIWGWATWRDRWVGTYDVTMSKWPRIRDEGRICDLVGSRSEAAYWRKIFDRTYRGEFDAWDYQWVFTNWIEGRVSVVPTVNLISNIGFSRDATHTTGTSDLANLPRSPSTFPLRHPIGRFTHREADEFSFNKCFGVPLLKRVSNKLAGSL